MITRNSADSNENSVAAVNNGSGSQHIDNGTHIHLNSLVNLASTSIGSIVFDPSSMREVIINIDSAIDKREDSCTDFKIIDVEEKNKLNGLTQEYYDDFIAISFEPYFSQLDKFLKQRENEDLQQLVSNIVCNLNRKIFIKRKYFDTFEELLASIEEALLDSEFKHLQGKEDAISLFLYYLYAACFIGKKTKEERKC
ncbi:ABC-three component system protein [Moritella sp. 28]|uniref:ABC-three component system protein n=1 Tax=Moritella sp. 28 TaxID=2746232 RepID=UPI001BA79884|nr:ABC-three component system protein [Moritella sp. 28]QUM85467.1 hypothetical protein HWV02_13610 [Moritella sp. 28]